MHAVLITAYIDYPSLKRLVRRLDRRFFKVYVHVCGRSAISEAELEELQRLGAAVARRHKIRWGSIAHLNAIMDLLRQAVADGGADYYHIISGQDYPLFGPDEFERRCDGRIFMNFEPLSASPADVRDRCELRNVFYFLQTGSRAANRLHRYVDMVSRWLQKRLGRRRSAVGPFDRLYKGIVWMSFPAAAAEAVLSDPAAEDFLRAVRTIYVPEEVYFQTYFLNSALAPSVVNDDLRYTDWRRRNGSVPAFLDQSDGDRVLGSNALFARKVNSDVSTGLLDMIDAARFTPKEQQQLNRPVTGA
jgi:hypothetical protein